MTVNSFDKVTTSAVDYTIYDSNSNFVASFTRDVFQEQDAYLRNLVKFDKYADAEIQFVRCMNDIIRVDALIKDRSTDDAKE